MKSQLLIKNYKILYKWLPTLAKKKKVIKIYYWILFEDLTKYNTKIFDEALWEYIDVWLKAKYKEQDKLQKTPNSLTVKENHDLPSLKYTS